MPEDNVFNLEDNRKLAYVLVEQVVFELCEKLDLSINERYTYITLLKFSNFSAKTTRIKQKTLMKHCKLSKPTVIKILRKLKEYGFIDIKQNYDKTTKTYGANTYTILDINELKEQLEQEQPSTTIEELKREYEREQTKLNEKKAYIEQLEQDRKSVV